MAITKERKEEVLSQYADWMKRSQAVILVEYTGVKMKDLDNIRAKIREAGGEFHVVKNTLARRAFADSGMEFPGDYLVKSTAISFAFTDPASTAKALTDATKGLEAIKVKEGYPVQSKVLWREKIDVTGGLGDVCPIAESWCGSIRELQWKNNTLQYEIKTGSHAYFCNVNQIGKGTSTSSCRRK